MNISALIDALGHHYGLSLALEPGRAMAIEFEEAPVHLEHDVAADLLHLYVTVGQEPSDGTARSSVHAWMLEANLFGRRTGGCQLGLDASLGELLLTRQVELRDVNVSTLAQLLDSMLETALRCRAEIQSRAEPAHAAPGAGLDAVLDRDSLTSFIDLRA